MSTRNKIIIYDDACPLCAAYTSAFVQTGMIDASGRKNFSTIDGELLSIIDSNRCRSEIPVIDSETKQVWYGIDGLLEILGQKQQWIKTIGHKRPVKWLLYRLYRLISYNRRVIVANTAPAGNFDCTPELNTKYRSVFMLLFLCFNTLMLLPVWRHVMQDSIFSTGLQRLQAAHFVLVATNIILFFIIPRKVAWEYIGQVNMLALVTILLLVPLVILNSFFADGLYDLNNFYLGALSLFTINEYRRRMKFAGVLKQHKWIVIANVIAVGWFLIFLTR